MASVQQHFDEAERLLAEAEKWHVNSVGAGTLATRAQAHAILAQAIIAARVSRDIQVELDTDGNADGADELWVRTDVSDVMQTVEIHNAPAPGDESFDEDGGPF